VIPLYVLEQAFEEERAVQVVVISYIFLESFRENGIPLLVGSHLGRAGRAGAMTWRGALRYFKKVGANVESRQLGKVSRHRLEIETR